MREIIRKFTMGHAKQMIAPVAWLFLEGVSISFPAIAVYFAINILIASYSNPVDIDIRGLNKIAITMFVLFLIQFIISMVTFLRTFLPAAKHSSENKMDFIHKLRKLPLGFFSKKMTGELINTFTGDFLALEQSMVGLFTGILGLVISCILTSVFMFYFNPVMATAFYLTLPIAGVILFFSLKTLEKLSIRLKSTKDKISDVLNEYLIGMKVLKSYNQTGEGFSRLKNAYMELMKQSMKAESIGGSLLGLALTFVRLGLPLMCFVGAYLLLGGKTGLVEYLSLIIIGTKIISPLLIWVRHMAVLRNHVVSANRIDNIMRESELSGNEEIKEITDIVFDNVSFSYLKESEEPVLNNISFTIPSGKLTAIVGASGSGKSTILRLIARFWDIDSGSISIGNNELSSINPETWLKNISMVLQEVYLFNQSIRDNILFGRHDATEEEMIEAAQKASCHDFIMQLPDGYDTIVGEGGSTLSGGEKQRISIARAILKNAPILLLDEPTSSLDAKNEDLVQNAISNLVKDKTVVMIAHRLKTIENADQIIVLEKGRVIEVGSHRELIKQKKTYHRFWNLQNKSKEWIISRGGM